MTNEKDLNLDDYEKDILEDYENDKFVRVKDSKDIKQALFHASEKMIKKNKKITIRVSENDLSKLKSKSIENGIPYQTTLNVLIHQYVKGDILIKL